MKEIIIIIRKKKKTVQRRKAAAMTPSYCLYFLIRFTIDGRKRKEKNYGNGVALFD